jgi:hypothetical protein
LLLMSLARGYIIQSILPQAHDQGRPSLSRIQPDR